MRQFRDRVDAGRQLGKALANYKSDAVVLGLPRGGVPVAAEVADELGAPLDLIVARKIGHPSHGEYAIGAISDDGYSVFNEGERENVDPAYLREETERQLQEAVRRRKLYLGDRTPANLEGKTAILVDDGIATGYTMLAAIHSVINRHPKALVVAVPVGPQNARAKIDGRVDDFVCLLSPEFFFAIGAFYEDFSQVTDDEVSRVMRAHVPA